MKTANRRDSVDDKFDELTAQIDALRYAFCFCSDPEAKVQAGNKSKIIRPNNKRKPLSQLYCSLLISRQSNSGRHAAKR